MITICFDSCIILQTSFLFLLLLYNDYTLYIIFQLESSIKIYLGYAIMPLKLLHCFQILLSKNKNLQGLTLSNTLIY